MRDSSTNRRANEQAREAMASILLFDISDSALQSVTITGCKVSPDRSHCFVYYSAPAKQYAKVEAAFERAAGRIRGLMTKRLNWRVTPALHFILDNSVDDAMRITAALHAEAEALEGIIPDAPQEDLSEIYRGLE